MAKKVDYLLPKQLIRRADLARLVREVEDIDSELEAQKVRSKGSGEYRLPNMSNALSECIAINKIEITDDHTRMLFKENLRALKDSAPIVHLTFAIEADPASLQTIASWLRDNIHPQTLIEVGLQPGLIAGVYMRTPNQVHDFTIKNLFAQKRDVMIRLIEELK